MSAPCLRPRGRGLAASWPSHARDIGVLAGSSVRCVVWTPCCCTCITTCGNDIVLAALTTWRLATATAVAATTTTAGLNVFAAIPCGGAGCAALHARWWALEAAPELLYAALREAAPKVGAMPGAPTPAAPTSEPALSQAPVPNPALPAPSPRRYSYVGNVNVLLAALVMYL